jgi:hypothetical protein
MPVLVIDLSLSNPRLMSDLSTKNWIAAEYLASDTYIAMTSDSSTTSSELLLLSHPIHGLRLWAY